MKKAIAVLAGLPLALAGCGGVFESKIAAPQTYVLRLPPSASEAPALTVGSVLVQRPEAGPGLDSNRIALLRSDRRFDFYSASLWAAPAPDVVESVMVEALRGTRAFSAVFDDAAPFAWVEGRPEGVRQERCTGTYLHGALENPAVLRELLGIEVEEPMTKDDSYDRLADWFASSAKTSLFEELFL